MRVLLQRLTPAVALLLGLAAASAANRPIQKLVWDKERHRLEADVRGLGLGLLLERLAAETGWQVYVEPGTRHTASAKFKNLPPGEGLRLLLGDLNFSLVPQTNGSPRLYVFRSDVRQATRLVRAFRDTGRSRRIPNELVVQLRDGTDAQALAARLGAKVIGCIDNLRVCRLQFVDADAADAARAMLVLDEEVTAVDYNYWIDPPPMPAEATLAASTPSLKLNPPAGEGQIVIGLVDTPVQELCGELNGFLRAPISVVGQSVAAPARAVPTHATAMANMMLRSLQTATRGSTSVQILPVDVYGANATTTTYDVANGIVAAVNNGANLINLSLGGPGDSAFLQALIEAVRARGIPVIAAAGNEPVSTPFYPAAYPGVLAVSAGRGGQIAPYANHGSFVDVAAPDSDVFCYGGRSYYVRGTSAAAAYVSGLAAGLKEASGQDWDAVQKQILDRFGVRSATR
ncbi:MAG: S8 family serine peptidase [Verrucomicrobiales bacterium]|nr:S8 family serine peptidase [Verrucomicrobiales bacterium]